MKSYGSDSDLTTGGGGSARDRSDPGIEEVTDGSRFLVGMLTDH
jgi:hypothetical protein